MRVAGTVLAGVFAVSICMAQGAAAPAPMKDADGNVYQTVRIGDQVWMAENLRATRFSDGKAIPLAANQGAWRDLTGPGFCYPGNTTNSDSIKKFGALYNWNAVNTKKLAPSGWRVPDTTDWKVLESYLIANGYNWDGTTTGNKIAKSLAAKTDWWARTAQGAIGTDLSANNKSGFSALPAGCRWQQGSFDRMTKQGYWWSANSDSVPTACLRSLGCGGDSFDRKCNENRNCGFSVRLIKE